MDWLRNGCTFGENTELYMNVVSVPNDISGGTDKRKLTGMNKSMDYLLRGQSPKNAYTSNLNAYAFYSFYEKRRQNDANAAEPDANNEARRPRGRPPHPREPLAPNRPQNENMCLMRISPPVVPKIQGKIPRRPKGWIVEGVGQVVGEEEDHTAAKQLHEDREEYALFVMALFRDLHSFRPILKPEGATWWDVCLEWWRGLPTGDQGRSSARYYHLLLAIDSCRSTHHII